MRTLLNLSDPSPDWRGLAHVISKSDGLRDDVTLVIENDRVRLFDAECREIQTGAIAGRWSSLNISQLSSKLSLLDWLHENFSTESGLAIRQPNSQDSPVSAYFTSDRDERGIRSVATQSIS